MNDSHHHSLKQSIKDMISVEWDIFKALSLQLESDEVNSHSILTELLARAASESEERIDHIKTLHRAPALHPTREPGGRGNAAAHRPPHESATRHRRGGARQRCPSHQSCGGANRRRFIREAWRNT